MTASLKNRTLQLENLESRQMMIATHLVLDFTPDYRGGTFWQTFQNSRLPNGQAPAFLDFNGDRRITTQDAEIAAGQIRNTIGSFFAGPARGYNVSIGYNDVLNQTYFGNNYLVQGQKSANDQVLVMYFGGRDVGEIGRAPLAQDGYNVEGYGNTYTQTIAHMLMNRAGSTKDAFVWAVANTAAHEFGHMLGLRHSRGGYSNDIMNATQGFTPWNDRFSTVNQYTEGGGVQNSYRELQYSFAGQRTYFQGVKNGFAQLPSEGRDHAHEGHAEEGCDLDLDAVLAGFDATATATEDPLPAEAVADSLAAALAGQVRGPATVRELTETALDQPLRSPAQADLISLLAFDLHRDTSDKSASGLAAKPATVRQLDEVFTDFGLVR